MAGGTKVNPETMSHKVSVLAFQEDADYGSSQHSRSKACYESHDLSVVPPLCRLVVHWQRSVHTQNDPQLQCIMQASDGHCQQPTSKLHFAIQTCWQWATGSRPRTIVAGEISDGKQVTAFAEQLLPLLYKAVRPVLAVHGSACAAIAVLIDRCQSKCAVRHSYQWGACVALADVIAYQCRAW